MEVNYPSIKIIDSVLSSINKKIKKVKDILNNYNESNLTDEQVEDLITAFNYLVDVQYLITDFKDRIKGENCE